MSSANKMLTFLLVFSILVSVGGTFLLIDGILGFSNFSYTGAAISRTNVAFSSNIALVLAIIIVIILTLLIMGLVNRNRRK